MGLFAQPPLGANAACESSVQGQSTDAQSGCKIGEVMAQVAQIETPINATQKVIGWNVIFKVERVKQSRLPTQ
jgi:hypothetical protein